MVETWHPTEEKITALIETKTPRQLAIAYLRASRRAKQAELVVKMLGDLDKAQGAAEVGDFKGIMEALRSVEAAANLGKESGAM